MFQFTDKIIYFIVHTASFITNKIRKNDKNKNNMKKTITK